MKNVWRNSADGKDQVVKKVRKELDKNKIEKVTAVDIHWGVLGCRPEEG